MIRLEQVSKYYGKNEDEKCVLDEISCVFERGVSIGILGRNGVGKSTLMRIMDGTEEPTYGWVHREGSISRLGLSGGFHKNLTGEENVRFVSRIYGKDPEEILDYVYEFTELGDDLYRPVKTYSSGMKSRLRLGLSFAMTFDLYLIDESTSAGDDRFLERCRQEMESRLQTSDVIMVSHNPKTLRDYCTHAAILHNGKLSEIVELRTALVEYRRLML